jgi:hypothetical protein
MARVIFCVDLTDAIRIRTALSEGIVVLGSALQGRTRAS